MAEPIKSVPKRERRYYCLVCGDDPAGKGRTISNYNKHLKRETHLLRGKPKRHKCRRCGIDSDDKTHLSSHFTSERHKDMVRMFQSCLLQYKYALEAKEKFYKNWIQLLKTFHVPPEKQVEGTPYVTIKTPCDKFHIDVRTADLKLSKTKKYKTYIKDGMSNYERKDELIDEKHHNFMTEAKFGQVKMWFVNARNTVSNYWCFNEWKEYTHRFWYGRSSWKHKMKRIIKRSVFYRWKQYEATQEDSDSDDESSTVSSVLTSDSDDEDP